jgi:hypothetical protein
MALSQSVSSSRPDLGAGQPRVVSAQLDYNRDGTWNECDATPGAPAPETRCRTIPGWGSSALTMLGTLLLTALVPLSKLLRRKHGHTR